jgi:mono/diheme cytochrome c family protein
MSRLSRLIVIALVAAAVLLPRASPASGARPQDDARGEWTAPPSADARTNPLAGRADAEAGGAKLFRSHCAQCHREDGTGTSFGKGLTGRRVQAQSDGALFWKITSGNTRTGMPTFSGLPELQRWQLVLHLRALGSSHPPAATRP